MTITAVMRGKRITKHIGFADGSFKKLTGRGRDDTPYATVVDSFSSILNSPTTTWENSAVPVKRQGHDASAVLIEGWKVRLRSV